MNRLAEFNQGRAGVLPPKIAHFERRINDGIFTGPRGAYQRYNVSSAASDVARTPYKGSF